MIPTIGETAATVAAHLEHHPGSTTAQVLDVVARHLTWYGQQDTFLVLALHRAGRRAGFGQDDDGLWYPAAQRPALTLQGASPGARRLGLALEAVHRLGPDGIAPDTARVLREALHFQATSQAVDTTDRKETA